MFALFRLLQDSTPDVAGQFNLLLAGVLGLGSTLFTGVGKRIVAWITGADGKLTQFYKSVQPLVAMALGFLLPLAFTALHLHGPIPTGTVVASAPLGTLVFIGLRELVLHFFPPQSP